MLLDPGGAEVHAPGQSGVVDPAGRPASLTVGSPDRVVRRPRARWTLAYRVGVLTAEVVAAAVAAALVVLARDNGGPGRIALFWAAGALVVTWPVLLAATGAYDRQLFGTGSDEYRRVVRAGVVVLAVAGFVSFAFQLELSRALVVVAVPGLTGITLLIRFGARWQLRRLRSQGRCTKRVIVVGRGGAVLSLAGRLDAERFAGLQVVGLCVTPGERQRVTDLVDIPVGGLDDVLALAARLDADTIAVTSASETAAEYLRQLSWQMEGTGLELLVAPGLVEVAGPRLSIRPFEGLPLLAVEEPTFTGWRRVVKGLVDRSAAVLALLLLSPVLLAIALAVRLDSPGPVFYRQQRVGRHGELFTMLKFRSMVVDAEKKLTELAASNESDGLLFKMREDPRVTSVGRWMRRYSVDELPQLLNVLGGSMSLVGPRPPLPREVARYDDHVSRRLLVKPGLTGLWQISGRSDLPWDEAVRLDLRYVENWSLAMDVSILWQTGRAVLSSSGAY